MKSIKLDNNGDITFDSLGKLIFIEDETMLLQSLNLKLKTIKGELFYNDDYGHPILKGKQDEDSILNYVKDTLLDDERIIDISIIDFNSSNPGVYNVTVEIQLDSGKVLDFDFSL